MGQRADARRLEARGRRLVRRHRVVAGCRNVRLITREKPHSSSGTTTGELILMVNTYSFPWFTLRHTLASMLTVCYQDVWLLSQNKTTQIIQTCTIKFGVCVCERSWKSGNTAWVFSRPWPLTSNPRRSLTFYHYYWRKTGDIRINRFVSFQTVLFLLHCKSLPPAVQPRTLRCIMGHVV